MMWKENYFRLFVRREGRVVLGRGGVNLWLLTAVLTLTFLATAFSNASLRYLSFKMNDPFINWVNIERTSDGADYAGLHTALQDTAVCADFHIADYQEDYRFSCNFLSPGGELHYLSGRFFQTLNTPLIDEILSGDNCLEGQPASGIDPHSVGLILTGETLERLGYARVPAFIDFARWSPGADTLGFDLYTEDGYAKIPLPVLGVVKRLPNNADFISTAYLLEQELNDRTFPFLLNKAEYASSLIYFVPETADAAQAEAAVLSEAAAEGIRLCADGESFYMPEILPMRSGSFLMFTPEGEFSRTALQNVNRKILDRYADTDLTRVYPYQFSYSPVSEKTFLSVHFRDLGRIRAFERFAHDGFHVPIEMSQIHTKENFNAVSVLGNILSAAIVAFSIFCIVLFIINLLQSYFQKIRQNIGIFKAFGISNRELTHIYLFLVTGVLAAAIVLSLCLTFLIQRLLPLAGILQDGTFSYLSLWSAKTGYSIVIILLSAVLTVYFVTRRLLASTPGDLIYDRSS